MIRASFAASLLLLFAFSTASAQHDHGSAPAGSGPPPLYSGLGTLHHKVTTKSPVAQKQRDEKKTGERNYPASDWHRKSFSIRDRRAQAGWRSAIALDRSASR